MGLMNNSKWEKITYNKYKISQLEWKESLKT